jgi:cyclophilin family peptidyl-prolyl cis-trans isomerase
MNALTKNLLLLLLAGFTLGACSKNKDTGTVTQDVAIPGADSGRPPLSDADRNQQAVAIGDYPTVELATSRGRIVIALYNDKAPANVRNFLAYVDSGHYDNTVFHRVVDNLLVQGGAFTPDYRIKTDRGFVRSEAGNGLRNTRGTVAAARRLNDADAAGSQFFINLVDNPQFDFVSAADAGTRGYTVFGRVVEGMDVLDEIRSVPTKAREGVSEAVPLQPIILQHARQLD